MLLLVRRDAAGAVLAGVGTGSGVVLYLLLWGLSVMASRRALRGVMDGTGLVRRRADVVAEGMSWGGAVGAFFLLGLAAVLLTEAVLAVGLPPEGLGVLASLALGLAVAGAAAYVVGALVGAAMAGLDLLALRACDGLLPAPPPSDRPESEKDAPRP